MKSRHIAWLAFPVLASVVLGTARAEDLGSMFARIEALDKSGKKIETLEALKNAVADYAASLPLQAARSLFVIAPAKGFGAFSERAGSLFTRGDRINIYVEPIGVKWVPLGNGVVGFNTQVDVRITTADNSFSLSQNNVMTMAGSGRVPSTDIYFNFFIDTRQYPAGDYTVQFIIHDRNKNEAATVEKHFTLK